MAPSENRLAPKILVLSVVVLSAFSWSACGSILLEPVRDRDAGNLDGQSDAPTTTGDGGLDAPNAGNPACGASETEGVEIVACHLPSNLSVVGVDSLAVYAATLKADQLKIVRVDRATFETKEIFFSPFGTGTTVESLPRSIQLEGEFLYLSGLAGTGGVSPVILAVKTDGSQTRTIAEGTLGGFGTPIALGNGVVCYSTKIEGAQSIECENTATENIIAAGGSGEPLAIRSNELFFVSANNLRRMPVAGGTPIDVVTAMPESMQRTLTLDDRYVYYAFANGPSGGTSFEVWAAPQSEAGSPHAGAIISVQGDEAGRYPLSMRVDISVIYWTNGALFGFATAGDPESERPFRLAPSVSGAPAFDDQYVYFAQKRAQNGEPTPSEGLVSRRRK